MLVDRLDFREQGLQHSGVVREFFDVNAHHSNLR